MRAGAERVGVTDVVAYPTEVDGLAALVEQAEPGDVVGLMCHAEREEASTPGSPSTAARRHPGDPAREGARGRTRPPTSSVRRRWTRARSPGRRPGPPALAPLPACAWLDQFSSSAITAACLSTQTTTRSPLLARLMACRTASISSSTISTCLQRAPSAIALRTPSVTSVGDVAALPAPQRLVLADDDDVEVLGGDVPELAHVLVAAVAGGGDDADPRGPRQVVGRRQRLADPVDEVAEHPHARGVVAVVDDDVDAVDLDLVEAAGGEVVVRRERAQALPDVVQRRAGGEGGGGRGQRVLHVHPGPAAERRGQQVGPGQLHLAAAVLDDDHLAALGRVEDQRLAAAAAVGVDHLAGLATRAPPSRTRRPRRCTGGASRAPAGRRR